VHECEHADTGKYRRIVKRTIKHLERTKKRANDDLNALMKPLDLFFVRGDDKENIPPVN
jgi:hypothetical protein